MLRQVAIQAMLRARAAHAQRESQAARKTKPVVQRSTQHTHEEKFTVEDRWNEYVSKMEKLLKQPLGNEAKISAQCTSMNEFLLFIRPDERRRLSDKIAAWTETLDVYRHIAEWRKLKGKLDKCVSKLQFKTILSGSESFLANAARSKNEKVSTLAKGWIIQVNASKQIRFERAIIAPEQAQGRPRTLSAP